MNARAQVLESNDSAEVGRFGSGTAATQTSERKPTKVGRASVVTESATGARMVRSGSWCGCKLGLSTVSERRRLNRSRRDPRRAAEIRSEVLPRNSDERGWHHAERAEVQQTPVETLPHMHKYNVQRGLRRESDPSLHSAAPTARRRFRCAGVAVPEEQEALWTAPPRYAVPPPPTRTGSVAAHHLCSLCMCAQSEITSAGTAALCADHFATSPHTHTCSILISRSILLCPKVLRHNAAAKYRSGNIQIRAF